MPMPDDYTDEGRNYRVRVCIQLVQNPLIGFITGSKVGVCDRCGEPIWVQENQPLPDPGVEVHGDLTVCMECVRILAAEQEEAGTPIEFIDGHSLDDLT
jgi:hypothetical protein